MKTISKEDLNDFFDALILNELYEIHGVQAKGDKFIFGPLDSSKNLRLDYDVTILPPKKYFLPQYENLMDFQLKKDFSVKPNIEEKPRILIGMHPYDIIALEQTDKVYLDEQKDDFYEKRRKNTIIIGVDIQTVSEYSFAGSLGTHYVESGFDLMLTNIGEKYVITIGTQKGEELIKKYAKTNDATETDAKEVIKVRAHISNSFKKHVQTPDLHTWSSLLVANYDNSIWEERSQKCMECSSCTMVCPTCFCYDVHDDVSLNLKNGSRMRSWDGCLLKDFTKVGSGEVFRDDLKDRYRHRFFRKGNYLT